MKLSDAIALGLPEIDFNWTYWLWFKDGECKGCLAGAALYANGRRTDVCDLTETIALAQYWPWVNGWRWDEVMPCCGERLEVGSGIGPFLTHLARHYAQKELTAEQVIEIVRSVEPAEQESQLPASGFAAQPDLGVEAIALPEDKLEAMVESWRDAEAGTR